MDTWIWPVLMVFVGLALAILELFFVSHGILSVLAVLSLITAVVMGFMYSTLLGEILLTVSMLGIPGFVVLAIYIWPRTPIGRRVLLPEVSEETVLPDNPQLKALQSLVGEVGLTKASLLPSGPVEINGRTYDALSEGSAIEAGVPVRVVAVQGAWIVVRPLADEEDDDTESLENSGSADTQRYAKNSPSEANTSENTDAVDLELPDDLFHDEREGG
ncbi:MAG: hypothetical protein D6741_20210 [Planctomycetota bacterium]|nr:MAG: hypothetical protein D6741_20210 [Planctomycetota bacterium]